MQERGILSNIVVKM